MRVANIVSAFVLFIAGVSYLFPVVRQLTLKPL